MVKSPDGKPRVWRVGEPFGDMAEKILPRARSQWPGEAALLHALEIERADVMGYSQGGGVALQLALRHPQLVSKLELTSCG